VSSDYPASQTVPLYEHETQVPSKALEQAFWGFGAQQSIYNGSGKNIFHKQSSIYMDISLRSV
jgi:hypothetical protein